MRPRSRCPAGCHSMQGARRALLSARKIRVLRSAPSGARPRSRRVVSTACGVTRPGGRCSLRRRQPARRSSRPPWAISRPGRTRAHGSTTAQSGAGTFDASSPSRGGGRVAARTSVSPAVAPWCTCFPDRSANIVAPTAQTSVPTVHLVHAPECLLRRHERWCSDRAARACRCALSHFEEARDSEVEDEHPAVARKEDVLGLDVSVNNLRGVRLLERREDVVCDRDDLDDRELSARRCRARAQRLALEKGHHQEDTSVLRHVVVDDRNDAGRADLVRQQRLATEEALALRVHGEALVQYLDRHLVPVAMPARIDGGHAADADEAADSVPPAQRASDPPLRAASNGVGEGRRRVHLRPCAKYPPLDGGSRHPNRLLIDRISPWGRKFRDSRGCAAGTARVGASLPADDGALRSPILTPNVQRPHTRTSRRSRLRSKSIMRGCANEVGDERTSSDPL